MIFIYVKEAYLGVTYSGLLQSLSQYSTPHINLYHGNGRGIYHNSSFLVLVIAQGCSLMPMQILW